MRHCRDRLRLCAWLGLFAGGALAQNSPATSDLSVLGAANGAIEVRAGTEEVAIPLTIESTAMSAIGVILRPTPFLDANNYLHPAQIKQPEGTAVAELSVQIPAASTLPVVLLARLGPEGKYTGGLLLLVGDQRNRVTMTVTRSLEEAHVQTLGIEQITRSASRPTHATLRLTLAETSSRALTLHQPVLIEYARKQGNARTDARFKIERVEPASGSISLAAGESKELQVMLTGFEGAGEYVGKIRFAGTGFKPVDAAFTVILRDSAWIAFVMILMGVALSVALRWLTQKVRPQLLERRRLYRLILLLDAQRREPAREMEETQLLEALRIEGVAWLAELGAGKIAEARAAIDLLEARRRLFIEWVPWRRRVRELSPPELAEKFSPTIEEVAQTIRASSTKELIEAATMKLRALGGGIDAALQEILQMRIGELTASVTGTLAGPDGTLKAQAQEQLLPMLKDAERQLTLKNSQSALQLYSRARARWVSGLFGNLGEVLGSELPLNVDDEVRRRLIEPLVEEARRSEALVTSNPDLAIREYNVILNRYVAALCEILLKGCDEVERQLEAADGAALSTQRADELRAELKLARDAVAQVREMIQKGDREAALSEIWRLLRAVATIRKHSTSPGVLSKHAPTVSDAINSPVPVPFDAPSLPGGLSDPQRTEVESLALELPITHASVGLFTRLASTIDLFSTAIAIIIASVLGITTLWANDATWGGWQDYLVAFLWGLGLHQFTFTGVNNLRDRISGNEVMVNTQ